MSFDKFYKYTHTKQKYDEGYCWYECQHVSLMALNNDRHDSLSPRVLSQTSSDK